MLNCQNEQKDKASSPSGETLALLGQDNHQMKWNVAPPGPPASCHTCQTSKSKLPRALEIVQSSLVASCPSWSTPSARGCSPQIYAKDVLMRAFLLLCVHGLITKNPVLHLPSQRPSDGLFSPMEVRTDHLPMCTDPLVPVRRAWSCTSKGYALQGLISPKHHGNVNQISSLKLSNACMTPLTDLLRAQRPYTDPPYKVKATKG
jgi:hypothetical protein